jgi:aspartyl-tRNA(Asn)/glutamyl-tRNA(Gln) amidotransferase subunit A
MTHLSQLGIGELRAALDKRETSSVEITKALLESIEAKKGLNTFAEVSVDLALGQAKTADEKLARGEKTPLLGVPIALKDNILAVGTKTTCGSKILNNFVSPYDATVTAKLKSNGAVILGKTNMDEFAMGSSNETSFLGTVKNPWDNSRVPGGSSGGSAAATLAGLAPGALGTDTGGSVRQPASLCGVYGLKPTYGRVSRYGIVAFASSLDQVGTFARSASDLASLTEVISGHDPLDSTSVSQPLPSCTAALTKGVKGLRIGVPKEYFIKGLDAEVESAVRTAVKEIEKLGATVVPVSLPHTEHSLAVYYVLAPAEASSNLARFDGIRYGYRVPDAKDLKDLYYRSRSEGFGKEVKRRIMVGAFVLSTGYYDAYYLRAQKVRTLVARDFTNAFTQCDVIASPVAPTTAFKIGEKTNDPIAMYLSDVFTIPVNLAGLPGMSIPCGMDSKGLPVGLQLIGKPWDEETLFRVAGAYEAATDWHKKRPQA